MANPTLTRGATNFLTSGSTTLELYGAQRETLRKDAGFINIPIPTTDADSTIVFDLLGTTQTFTVSGIFTKSDNADNYKFVRDLASLIDGAQGDTGSSQVGYTYRPRIWNDGDSVQTDDLNVYVQDVEINEVAGEPTKYEYNVTLLLVDNSSSG